MLIIHWNLGCGHFISIYFWQREKNLRFTVPTLNLDYIWGYLKGEPVMIVQPFLENYDYAHWNLYCGNFFVSFNLSCPAPENKYPSNNTWGKIPLLKPFMKNISEVSQAFELSQPASFGLYCHSPTQPQVNKPSLNNK